MKKVILLVLFSVGSFGFKLWASDLKIENIRTVNRTDVLQTPLSVIFDISWNNSWHNSKNHDAVWVFMKYGGAWDNHVKIEQIGQKVLKNRTEGSQMPIIEVSADGTGFFIYPPKNSRGHVSYKLQIIIDSEDKEIKWNQLKGLSVHGVEMVYIPKGSFFIGSPDEAAIKRSSLYKSDGNGNPKGLIQITSEDQIEVGPKNNALYYWSEETLYNGDQKGSIPNDFPKGYEAFYIMKYELTQGQYAEFLNKLPDSWTYKRSPTGGKSYYKNRGGIRLIEGVYIADNPVRPLNYASFTDALAYTDWAGLRPITELEYEKAARGPSEPIDAEFVWGTNTYDDLERYVNDNSELVFTNGFDESMLNDNNRSTLGASYYWVMDLSGSLWEKVITIGNPIGRTFKGTHGDGILSFGNATNEDWPKSDDELGGFGYRGGGYYEIGTGYSDFNPHSPIGYRYYGAWSGGPNSIAYGYRAGRSVE